MPHLYQQYSSSTAAVNYTSFVGGRYAPAENNFTMMAAALTLNTAACGPKTASNQMFYVNLAHTSTLKAAALSLFCRFCSAHLQARRGTDPSTSKEDLIAGSEHVTKE